MTPLNAPESVPCSAPAAQCELASNQRLIWLGQQRYPDLPLYEIPHVFVIRGNVDSSAFQAAFSQWVEATEVLRTVAADIDWSATVTLPNVVATCELVDLVNVTGKNAHDAASEFVCDRMARRFQVTEALYDSVLLKLCDTESWWLFRVHHLLTDGLNARQILRSMTDCYVAQVTSSEVRPKPQYRDFLQFERQVVRGDDFTDHTDWWKQRTQPYAGSRFYSAGTLPDAKDGNPRHHQRVTVRLTHEENDTISRLAAEVPFRQLTPALSHYSILATTVVTLLHRLEQCTEIRFGATSHGRTTRQFRDTVGLFMQLLPFQVDVVATDTFSILSSKVAIETQGFLQHAVAGVMQPDTAKAFDVALNVLDLTVDDFAGMRTSLEWLHNGYGDPGRKLTISAYQLQDTDEWELLFDFNLAVFCEVQQQRLIDNFRCVLLAMTQPDLTVGSFSIVSFQDLTVLLGQSVPATSVANRTLWDRFLEMESEYPDRIAIRGGEDEFTFRELRQQADQVSAALVDCGSLVPLLCRRDASAVIGMLGVLASGRCFLPIELDQPQARIDTLLTDCGASFVVQCDWRAGNVSSRISVSSLPMNQGIDVIGSPACDLTHDACYVLYTSGSSGQAKGVVVGHESVLNLLEEFERLAPTSDAAPINDGRGCWWTNVGFDVAIYEVFSALLYGRTLCIPDDSIRNSSQKLFAWMRQQQIASAYLPPFFLAEFSNFLLQNSYSALQRLVVGVAPIPQRLLATISRQIPELKIINGYGPTEATVCATLHVINKSDDSVGPASIGKPVSGNVLRIVDQYDQLVPVGVPGELLIGGVGLARGYLGQEVPNQQRFYTDVPDERSAVWYRTGDIVCLREDGNLLFRGRIDDQIKVRGHRIEPGEVTAIIRSLPGVVDVAVFDIGDAADKQLAAVVVGDLMIETLRSRLARILPRYLVPQQLLVLSELPRTINGKPNITALRELFRHRKTILECVAARTPYEFTLVAVWQQVLKRNDFGVTDHFFELGGDSLDAMKVVAAAEQLGINLRFQSVFAHPTVRQLAAEISTAVAGIDETAPSEPTAKPVQSYPLSPGQRSLWYLTQVAPRSGAYHIQILVAMKGTPASEVIEHCLIELTRRHESLRMTFPVHDGVPMAFIRDQGVVEFSVQETTLDTDLHSLCRLEGTRPFDLNEGPLLRVLLVRIPINRSYLVLTAHHIAVDQESMRTLLNDLEQLYNNHFVEPATVTRTPSRSLGDRVDQEDAGCPSRCQMISRSERAASIFEFAKWKQEDRQCNGEKSLQFWRDNLAECAVAIDLPSEGIVPLRASEAGDLHCFSLSSELSESLRHVAKTHMVSLHTLLLAAFQTLLHRYSNEERFVVGVPVSHRHQSRFAETVGYLIESLPFPCSVSGEQRFSELLTATATKFTACLGNFAVPLEEIVSGTQSIRTLVDRPLFQTMFVMQQSLVNPTLHGVEVTRMEIAHLGESKFDLTVFVVDAEKLECMLEYRTDLFSDPAINRIQQHWIQLLKSISSDPNTLIRNFVITCDEDQQSMLRCNRLSSPDPSSLRACATAFRTAKTIHEAIEAQVQRTPAAPALLYDGQTISYEELNQRADRLSGKLKVFGISEGMAVALCCDRSFEMIVGLLGILKSGAAYVPIDPEQPELRLRQILKDSGAVAIVSQTKFADTLTGHNLLILTEDDVHNGNAAESIASGARCNHTDANLAYILYTSGSTGEPKGVEVTHEGLLRSTESRFQFYDKNPQRFLLLSPIWFDSSVAGIFWTLVAGGTLVIPRDEQLLDIKALAESISEHDVTHTLCLPSLYQLLLSHAAVEKLHSLKCVIVAGEACSCAVVAQHFSTLPDTKLFNEYGPTEATVWATAKELNVDDANGRVSIGSAVPGSVVHLHDVYGNAVPIGITGEIHIGGPRLATGYRGRGDLTSERFTEDVNSPPSRIYRTGDLAKLRADGSLVFMGRSDDQIKINGQRIEPAEIEAVLKTFPGVCEVAVGLVEVQPSLHDDPATLLRQLEALPADVAAALLSETEQFATSKPTSSSASITRNTPEVSVQISFHTPDFIHTPRERQRKWLLDQALQETISDLAHLDKIAKTMVPGNAQPHIPEDLSLVRMTEQEIMEDWQTPLMKAMADGACGTHGDVLEIGFGRGVAASFIQSAGVRSHTIVEMNPHSISDFFVPWQQRRSNNDIRLVEGRWQDVLDQLSTYDTVFFHAFPMNEAEFIEYIANSSTFAEHFFPIAAKLLRPGGVFTYLTTEIDSLSRRHQRSLFQHFDELHQKVLPLSVPPETRDAWWANSMVVLRATKASQ